MTAYSGTTVDELERSVASITGQTRPPEAPFGDDLFAGVSSQA